MKKVKLSLANMVGKLTRNEMRYVLAGSGLPIQNNYVYGGPGQAMLSQARPYGNPQYPSGLNAPVGGNAANDANEIRYFGQAISNGVQIVGSAISKLFN